MAVNEFKFELILPDGIKYSSAVSSVIFAGQEGMLTVMANHTPLVVSIIPGVLSIFNIDGGESRFFLYDGVAYITPDSCVILSETAVILSELDPKEIEFRIEKVRQELSEMGGDAHDRSATEDFLHQLITVHGFFQNGEYVSKSTDNN
ncbi:ATP synthase F1 subunit epsilon [Bartonella sp. DGB1]|uniref:ATP synthase F1 subunit epsilon n=1 Tax=Bartonella sp. DGB1 TaxID=3239807 RepID=UPI0035263EFC